jgi:hypothetical protein
MQKGLYFTREIAAGQGGKAYPDKKLSMPETIEHLNPIYEANRW